jgi:hypothetical protein
MLRHRGGPPPSAVRWAAKLVEGERVGSGEPTVLQAAKLPGLPLGQLQLPRESTTCRDPPPASVEATFRIIDRPQVLHSCPRRGHRAPGHA